MKKAALFAAVAVMGVAAQDDSAAAEVEYLPDYDPKDPGPDYWSETSFGVGLVAGWYGPFTQRVMAYDCKSEAWSVGW
jgi:hypothetical protein